MKSNEEFFNSIYKKRDAKLKAIKKRKRAAAIIIPAFAVCIGIFALPGTAKSAKDADAAAPEIGYFADDNNSCTVRIAERFSESTADINDTKTASANQPNCTVAIPSPALTLNRKFCGIDELCIYIDASDEKDLPNINSIVIPLLDNQPEKLTDIVLNCYDEICSITVTYRFDDGCEYTFTCRQADSVTVINGANRSSQPDFSGEINGADITLWNTDSSGIYSGEVKVNGALLSLIVSTVDKEHFADETARFSFCTLADMH